MIPRRYSSEAVVLARRNYGEADRILIVYSRDYGKLHLLARGVRKLTSRKRGGVENFTNIKFAASRGKGLDMVTEVEATDTFLSVRKDLKKVAVAYFFCESVGRLTREGERHDEVYELLVNSLDALKRTKSIKRHRLNFIEELLTLLGFWPEGKIMTNHDEMLENIVEREMATVRVGKKLQI